MHHEYLCKWTGVSHLHNVWVPESWLQAVASAKIRNYKERTLVQEEHAATWGIASRPHKDASLVRA